MPAIGRLPHLSKIPRLSCSFNCLALEFMSQVHFTMKSSLTPPPFQGSFSERKDTRTNTSAEMTVNPLWFTAPIAHFMLRYLASQEEEIQFHPIWLRWRRKQRDKWKAFYEKALSAEAPPPTPGPPKRGKKRQRRKWPPDQQWTSLLTNVRVFNWLQNQVDNSIGRVLTYTFVKGHFTVERDKLESKLGRLLFEGS